MLAKQNIGLIESNFDGFETFRKNVLSLGLIWVGADPVIKLHPLIAESLNGHTIVKLKSYDMPTREFYISGVACLNC